MPLTFRLQIAQHKVSMVLGPTGCGKSSRVPLFLSDAAGNNSKRIVVTQPRRLAGVSTEVSARGVPPLLFPIVDLHCTPAISLASRVAAERGWALGKEVGYAVGQDRNFDDKASRIVFVTTGCWHCLLALCAVRQSSSVLCCYLAGWLFEKLLHSRESFLRRCSHIILDEIHERSVEADMLSTVLKLKLQEKSESTFRDVKLVLMSATFSSTQFAEYFAGKTEVPVLEVGQPPHPVELVYLDKLLAHKLLVQHSLADDVSESDRRFGTAVGCDVKTLCRAVDRMRTQLLNEHRSPSIQKTFGLILQAAVWLVRALTHQNASNTKGYFRVHFFIGYCGWLTVPVRFN